MLELFLESFIAFVLTIAFSNLIVTIIKNGNAQAVADSKASA